MYKKFTLFLLIVCPIINAQIISEKLVKRHLYTLSSDLMEGRKAGTEGVEKAAQYIEKEFSRIGLKKFENLETFRQTFIEKELSMFNIIGYLEGKNKKDEFVLISAHLYLQSWSI